MTPCTCDLCANPEERTARKLGQCHGYYHPTEPCMLDAVPGSLLCDDHARVQSDAVRALSREMAP